MMKLEALPEGEPALKNVPDTEHQVTLRQMMEGEILSLSQEELQAELRAGNAMATTILSKAGLTPETYSADLIAQWASVDMNILEQIRTKSLSSEEQLRLSALLQGAIGVQGTSFFNGDAHESISTPKFSVSPSVRDALQMRVCLEDHDSADRTWDSMRVEMLKYAIHNSSDHGAELIKALQKRGFQKIVENAERKSEDYIFFPHQEKHQPVPEGNAEDIYSILEDQEAAANRYNDFLKNDRSSPFDHWFDESSKDDEEADIHVPYQQPVHDTLTAHEGRSLLIATPNYECRWSPAYMAAAVRYVRAHPGVLLYEYEASNEDSEEKAVTRKVWDKTGYFLSNLISSAEQLSREEIPFEVLEYIAEQLSRPETDKVLLDPWPSLISAKDPLKALAEYFPVRRDRDMVEHALATTEKRSALTTNRRPNKDGKFNKVHYHQDGRGFQALAEWLRTHHSSDIDSKASFEAAIKSIETRVFGENRDELASHEYCVMQQYGIGGRSWQGGVSWSKAVGMRSFLLSYCLPSLPLEDAIDLCHQDSLTRWPGDPIIEEILSTKLKTHDDRWKLWQHLQTLGTKEHAELFLKYPHHFRSTFQQDLPRACTLLRKDLIEPLLESGSFEEFISCLDEYAKLDREEAKFLLMKASNQPNFQEKMLTPFTAKFRHDVFPAIFRICYANLTYPTPKQHPYLEDAEKPDSQLSSPLAILLNFEAKGGTPLFTRTIPLLRPEAVQESWWRIVHDQKYIDPPATQGGNGESSEKSEDPERKYAEKRDAILDQSDQSQNGSDDPDSPELPQAPNLSEQPRTVGTLSRPLSGDNRYLTTKICDRFNGRWSAHDPMEREACIALRDIVNQPISNADDDPVSLHMRMNHGAVVPMGMASEVTKMKTEHGRFRWAGHWSRRLDSASEAADVDIEYKTGSNRTPGDFTLDAVRSKLPQELQKHLHSLGKKDDLPPRLQKMLEVIDVTDRPMAEVVEAVRQIVLEYYEYCFILKHPEYAKKYRQLLQQMPHTGTRNAYLDFIHSLREEHEEYLGRGVCGQLSTVLQASLRSLGIPAYFATGYFTDDTTITTNDGHAWVIVPMLDVNGQLFAKPIESTGGASAQAIATTAAEAASASAIPEEVSDDTDEKSVFSQQHMQDIKEYFRRALGIDVSVSDIEASADVIRTTFHNDQRARRREVSDMSTTSALMPSMHLVTPRIADGVERVMDERVNDLSDGTRAILGHLLSEGREKYEEINRRFQEQGGFDDEWLAPSDDQSRT